jgi:hypothetical protein
VAAGGAPEAVRPAPLQQVAATRRVVRERRLELGQRRREGTHAPECALGGAIRSSALSRRAGAAGSLSSGLHHARRARGTGFCTFNGLALGARRAIGAGARSVLIIDLDAHCGGGTAELLADDPAVAQVDLAVDAFDWYTERGRFSLHTILDAADYLLRSAGGSTRSIPPGSTSSSITPGWIRTSTVGSAAVAE